MARLNIAKLVRLAGTMCNAFNEHLYMMEKEVAKAVSEMKVILLIQLSGALDV